VQRPRQCEADDIDFPLPVACLRLPWAHSRRIGSSA
jgi:hypothetical protein